MAEGFAELSKAKELQGFAFAVDGFMAEIANADAGQPRLAAVHRGALSLAKIATSRNAAQDIQTEPSILWMAIVGDPSAGKSPALRPVLKLVEPIDRRFVDEFGRMSAEHEARVAMAKAAKEDWERRARVARKDGRPAPEFPRDAIVPEPPTCRAFRVDDATILFCWPDPLPPKRPLPRKLWQVDWAENAFRRLFDQLQLARADDHEQPVIVPLGDDAADQFQAWREKHDLELVEGLAKDAWGKMPGQVLRLALALEMLAWCASEELPPEPASITAATIADAIALVDRFFKPMARRAYGDAGRPLDLGAGAALAKWIADERPVSFNAVSVRHGRGCPQILRDARSMDQACAVLIEAGWLRPCGSRDGATKGRTSKDYQVNPALWPQLDGVRAAA